MATLLQAMATSEKPEMTRIATREETTPSPPRRRKRSKRSSAMETQRKTG